MRWFNFLPIFDIIDVNEQPIGRIEEQFSWFMPTFRFISPSNLIQAEASRNFWGTTYTVIDTITEEVIATMHRSFFRFKDDWHVKIHNPELFLQKGIDFRLFVVVMAFQTDRDTWVRSMNSIRNYSVPSNDSEKPEIATEEDFSNSIKDLQNELESFRNRMDPVEPKEEDFATVDAIVTEKLKEESENANPDDASLNKLERGYKVLLPLLTQEGLSPSQKSTLFLMMDHHLKSVK
ncbi:MAG: hypothetical protein H0T62_05335 [Parachlamydiaceae bacterium]|nr:hypothetical protein [Parachlamydiaceae bacterium]